MRRLLLWFVLLAVVAVEPAAQDDDGARPSGRGTLVLGVAPVGSLDPAQARSVEQLLVAEQLFDSLTAYDPVTLDPVPALAARWDVTADQRRWTFRLRPGALFASGRAVTATDVKYSLERVARRGSGSPAAELLQPVAGYGAFRNGAAELAGVTTPAPDVVEIALEEPLAVLPSVLGSPVLSVVPREAVEVPEGAAPFAEAPVGSGPFRLVSAEGGVLSLEPSPGAPSKPAVARVDVVQYPDLRTAYVAFTRGQVDWARVPPDEVQAAARRYGEDAFRPYVAELFYGFNLKSPDLADRRVREAIVRGIDRRAVVAAVYHGTAAPAASITLDGLPGSQVDGCPRCGHDPDEARRLLAEAFPDGRRPEINLDYDADPTQEAMARAVQASLSSVGLPVVLRATAAEAYDRHVVSGEQEVFRLGWIAAYPSPDAVLTPLFRSGSPNNLTGYGDPVVDELLAAARREGDAARRAALYQEAERAIMDAVPVLPVAQLRLQSVVSRRVRRLVVTSLGTFDAAAVSLAGS